MIIEEADQDGDVFYDSTEYAPGEYEASSRGNQHFGQGEYKEAIEQYEHALVVCPLACTKERANEFKDAKDMCTQALKIDPNYTKALLRRAQASERIGTYASMSEALEDYKKLKTLAIDTYIFKECERAEKELPTKINFQMEKEKEEMLNKLKDVGNALLGKFGLSTDNFQFTKDPSGSGGYSVNFVNK
ncbi:hypothetical protein BCV71DRAFT_243760 [Rhizopus microsporus]|uniref:Uncharacterized protein n=1 Tax=Rhizopus microsporus TaxID=58291 RepID=A0A1X0S0U3_RHIZD|nr:hypothetical protein BCV71DRAFT_243760 [Rhizopus microsporus]